MAGLPLYQTLHSQLRTRIRDGHYPPGAVLPGEVELARQFGVSRMTMRKAMDQLAEDGLIARAKGRGSVVLEGRAVEPVRAEVSGLVENLLVLGLRTQVQVLHFAFETPPARIRREMGLPEGRQALHTVRLRHYKDKPFSYSIAWIPEDYGQTFARADLAQKSLTQLLRSAGVRACKAHQRVFATSADQTTGPLLGLPAGHPVLGIERRVEDDLGRVVEHLQVFYHPDRYEFEISMHSDPAAHGDTWRPA
ncbi:GntR family transcriptional regulator [Frigidibacter sp. MR17.24]|uniref:GntR family transcriptional regulator n=1 Tax=Frigidibacter sp. MR17.24 TaxID=3127345 RepID=UPI003012D066